MSLKRTAIPRRTSTLKRSPIVPKVAPDVTPKPPKGPRQRKCSNCGESFLPPRMGQKVCKPECAVSYARRIREQQERKVDRERKQSMKTRQDWLREAQAAFNAFIRQRDQDQPCISCGRFHTGSYDAGHYRSVGAAPALRFDEANVHKQCVPCNQHRGGNIVEYRIRLIEKIGRIAVEWLEREPPPAKYTIEDAQRIKALYKQKLKELQNVCP